MWLYIQQVCIGLWRVFRTRCEKRYNRVSKCRLTPLKISFTRFLSCPLSPHKTRREPHRTPTLPPPPSPVPCKNGHHTMAISLRNRTWNHTSLFPQRALDTRIPCYLLSDLCVVAHFFCQTVEKWYVPQEVVWYVSFCSFFVCNFAVSRTKQVCTTM